MDFSIRKKKRKDERLKLILETPKQILNEDKNSKLPQKVGLAEMGKAEGEQVVISFCNKGCFSNSGNIVCIKVVGAVFNTSIFISRIRMTL